MACDFIAPSSLWDLTLRLFYEIFSNVLETIFMSQKKNWNKGKLSYL